MFKYIGLPLETLNLFCFLLLMIFVLVVRFFLFIGHMWYIKLIPVVFRVHDANFSFTHSPLFFVNKISLYEMVILILKLLNYILNLFVGTLMH